VTPVGDLSGGERRRLQLLRLLAAEPNVLLLDEPTNDLDIDTLAALEDLLDSWPGTVIVASHDRYLIERVCDTVVAMYGDGRIVDLPGGVDEYLAVVVSGDLDSKLSSQHKFPVKIVGLPAPAGAAGARGTCGRRRRTGPAERLVGQVGAARGNLHDQLATHATDYEKVAAFDADLRARRRNGRRRRGVAGTRGRVPKT